MNMLFTAAIVFLALSVGAFIPILAGLGLNNWRPTLTDDTDYEEFLTTKLRAENKAAEGQLSNRE